MSSGLFAIVILLNLFMNHSRNGHGTVVAHGVSMSLCGISRSKRDVSYGVYIRRISLQDGRHSASRDGSGLDAFGFGRNGVVVFGDQTVLVANSLEQQVQTSLGLDSPEDVSVRKPGMGEDAVDSAEDFGHFTDLGLGRKRLSTQTEPAGEELGRSQSGSAPIERVAAVVDGAT